MSLLFVIAFLLHWQALATDPSLPWRSGGSSHAWQMLVGSARPTGPRGRVGGYVLREQPLVALENDELGGRSLDTAIVVWFAPRERYEGWWAPTRAVWSKPWIALTPLTREESAQVDRLVLAKLREQPGANREYLAALAAGTPARVLPAGYVHNAFALSLLVGLALTLPWYKPLGAKGVPCCKTCGYDLSNLSTTRCPECGSARG